MITIKLYGLIREQSGHKQLQVEAATVRGVMAQASLQGIDKKLFRQAIIFVNGEQISGINRFAYKLKDGDELSLLSALSGG